MATAAEVRAALLAQQNKAKGGKKAAGTGGDNASFPFWDIPTGSTTTVRFIADKDPENLFFWRPRRVIRLPFEGVSGGEYPTNDRVEVQVPCVEMFGMTCPIVAGTRHLWKDDATKPLARVYWPKKSFIYQGFVVSTDLQEENVPENPIRRFIINPTIHEIVEQALVDPDMEDLPVDVVNGVDFRISKTQKGDYANYQTSSWARKNRSLNAAETAAIEKYEGGWDLKEFQGRVPDSDELAALKAMFEASFAGEPFDAASFGNYYRAFGARGGANVDLPAAAPKAEKTTVAVSRPAVREEVETEAAADTVTESAAGGAPNPQDILARIRARSGK